MREEEVLGGDDDSSGVRAARLQSLIVRTFDVVLSLIGLVIAAPVSAALAVLIKLDSRGPVFFATPRVGKNMKLFPMYKFRTMLESSVKIDQSVCPQYDPRVTTIGRLLRRTKLNELPQLLNVLKGEMSFVGPRPEAPDLAGMYPEEAKRVFSVKPGLVGPVVISSLKGGVSGRNEEELYPPGVDPKRYYIEHILPEKVKIDLYYLSKQPVGTYIKVIVGAVTDHLRRFHRQAGRPQQASNIPLHRRFRAQPGIVRVLLLVVCQNGGARPSFKVFFGGLLLV
jgi:lipopolysaccharide/colanic/teichoic acid biosynthesis glycosyltransferase